MESSPINGHQNILEHHANNRTRAHRNKLPFTRYYREIHTAFCAGLGALSLGCVLGFSSPAIPDLTDQGLLVGNEASWFGSLITLGALFGSYVGGWIVEKYGRKATIVFSSVPCVIGWLLIVAGDSCPWFYAGRTLTGFAGGMTTLCVPLYIAEISSKQVRGVLGASFQIGTTTGILLVYTMGLFVSWQWLAVFSAAFPTVMVLLIQLCPETPRFLLLKGHTAEALKSLAKLRNTSRDDLTVMQELREIQQKIEDDSRQVSSSWQEFRSPHLYKPLCISLSLMFFQQFCGINAVIFYTEEIFQEAGYYKDNPGIPAALIAAVKVGATCFSTLIMDRAGRRKLFTTGGTLMTASCVTFGLYFYLTATSKTLGDISWLSLASLILYVTAFSLGWGSIPWLIMSEIFPTHARGKAASLATGFNWACAFLVTSIYLPLQREITPQGIFWCFAGVCFTGTTTMYCFMPETKDKTLEEIELYFRRKWIEDWSTVLEDPSEISVTWIGVFLVISVKQNNRGWIQIRQQKMSSLPRHLECYCYSRSQKSPDTDFTWWYRDCKGYLSFDGFFPNWQKIDTIIFVLCSKSNKTCGAPDQKQSHVSPRRQWVSINCSSGDVQYLRQKDRMKNVHKGCFTCVKNPLLFCSRNLLKKRSKPSWVFIQTVFFFFRQNTPNL